MHDNEASTGRRVTATVANATILGVRGDDRVARFRGIQYAQANRFGLPNPSIPAGELDATNAGTICPQPPSRLESIMGPQRNEPRQDEDCLNLAIYTPDVDAKLPVMVWLHGGGFTSGGGTLDWYDGSRLATDGDVVVVAVNYRIGALGYLLIDGVSPGNLGLHDQLCALTWVREHIHAFGGDPENITLFGQSAGALSISLILDSPQCPSGIRRAIVQSSPGGSASYSRAEAKANGSAFARHLGVDPRNASIEQILAAQRTTAIEISQTRATTPPFAPIHDMAPMLDAAPTPNDRPSDRHVELIVGYTRREGSAFAPATAPNRIAIENDVTAMFTDAAHALARRNIDAGVPVYIYRFDWSPSDDGFGATHCIELPFILGTEESWRDSPMLAATSWTTVNETGRDLRRAWTTFAHEGVLGPEWRPATSADDVGFVFSDTEIGTTA